MITPLLSAFLYNPLIIFIIEKEVLSKQKRRSDKIILSKDAQTFRQLYYEMILLIQQQSSFVVLTTLLLKQQNKYG